jgi:hypothetical protein
MSRPSEMLNQAVSGHMTCCSILCPIQGPIFCSSSSPSKRARARSESCRGVCVSEKALDIVLRALGGRLYPEDVSLGYGAPSIPWSIPSKKEKGASCFARRAMGRLQFLYVVDFPNVLIGTVKVVGSANGTTIARSVQRTYGVTRPRLGPVPKTKEPVWRSAAHHASTATVVPRNMPTASPSGALYARQVIH